MKLSALLVVATLGLPLTHAAAAPLDLHAYWDTRCKDCHGDSADFARRTLHVVDGRLAGTHHRDRLDAFLRQHYLSDELVPAVTAMLVAQVSATPLFKTQCGGCHGSASDFARTSLAMRGDTLVGKLTQRPVAEYLRSHGRLAAADIPAMVAVLARVLGEVSPAPR